MTIQYYVAYERAEDGGWGAYVPDLPGVGVVGYSSRDEARESIRQAIQMQIAGLREDGLPIPTPSGEFIEVDAA